MIWAAGLSGAAAVAVLLLAPPKATHQTAVQAAAMGWPPNHISMTGWTVSAAGVGAGWLAGLSVAGWDRGLALAVVAGTWLPRLVPGAIRALAAAAYRRERDLKMLEWMRKLRLLTSAGQPINAAAVNAALTVSGRAFAVAQGAIGTALEAGRDPLPAVASAIADSPAEPLLASVVAAERAGAASSDLLDKSLSRSVRTLESERRLAIDQLSRAIGTTVTLVAAIAGLVVMAAVIFVL
ncbi:type II secretion system F family protein [Candidatus Poriferisocius sp.]|uniref:type II secretion system F family protein n=1 Tax=Candidatus Poriferisocius sp. TaxID=3101276 RepID=UPI003B02D400